MRTTTRVWDGGRSSTQTGGAENQRQTRVLSRTPSSTYSCRHPVMGPLTQDVSPQYGSHDNNPNCDRNVLDPERQQPVPGERPVEGQGGEGGRRQRHRNEEIE